MTQQTNSLEDVILFLAGNAPAPLGVTQLMKLVYLADVEHIRRYGEPLTGLTWTRYHYGPFTRQVYAAVETLSEEGMVTDEVTVTSGSRQRRIRHARSQSAPAISLTPRAERTLVRVLAQYGHLQLDALKAAAYETEPMAAEQRQGRRLDLSLARKRSLSSEDRALAEFLRTAPEPDRREWGDPAASAREDSEIMTALAGWRAEANRDVR